MPTFDVTESAFLDYLEAGHSRRAAAGWLGFTGHEFEERIKDTDGLARQVEISEAKAQFKLEQAHMDPDNRLGTRNTLTELTNRYSEDWGKPIVSRTPFDGAPERSIIRPAPTMAEMFNLGRNTDENEDEV